MWEPPGSIVVKTSPFNAGDDSSVPSPGAKILHASWPIKKKKKKKKNKTGATLKTFKKWSTSKHLKNR